MLGAGESTTRALVIAPNLPITHDKVFGVPSGYLGDGLSLRIRQLLVTAHGVLMKISFTRHVAGTQEACEIS